MKKVRMISSILEIIIGVALLTCSYFGLVDEFWSGCGSALLIVGIIFLLRNIKYQTNAQYRDKIDVQINDERNKYISTKAWSWTGYLVVVIAAVGTLIFKFLGKEELMLLCSGFVSLVVLIYWISYCALRKKY
jgi:uncharacterized membrane protein